MSVLRVLGQTVDCDGEEKNETLGQVLLKGTHGENRHAVFKGGHDKSSDDASDNRSLAAGGDVPPMMAEAMMSVSAPVPAAMAAELRRAV